MNPVGERLLAAAFGPSAVPPSASAARRTR